MQDMDNLIKKGEIRCGNKSYLSNDPFLFASSSSSRFLAPRLITVWSQFDLGVLNHFQLPTMWPRLLVPIFVLIMQMVRPLKAYYLTIDAHAEECFFDRVTTGTKMGLTFEVIDGGFYDIDVKITGKMILRLVLRLMLLLILRLILRLVLRY